jgi:hypothetical protein
MNAYFNILQEISNYEGGKVGLRTTEDNNNNKVIRKAEQLFNKSWRMGFFISEEKTFSM